MFEILLLFWFAHCLADYPLQGILAIEKNRHKEKEIIPWQHAMMAHCVIHAGFVGIIVAIATGNHLFAVGFALVEYNFHWIIDNLKCDDRINFKQDQLCHIICKVFYTLTLMPYLGWITFA